MGRRGHRRRATAITRRPAGRSQLHSCAIAHIFRRVGAGHGHTGPTGGSAGGRHVRRLWISLGVLLAFLALEVVVGVAMSSLALLSDAGHMFTDVQQQEIGRAHV